MTNPKALSILAILIVAAGAAWWFYSGSQAPKSGADGAGGGTSAAGGPTVQVTLPTNFTAIAQDGKILFERNCADCHGENAAGSGNGPPLVHKIYEPGHHGDQAFILAARNGVRAHHWKFGNMPPRSEVREAEVVAIVSYVRELQRANGIF